METNVYMLTRRGTHTLTTYSYTCIYTSYSYICIYIYHTRQDEHLPAYAVNVFVPLVDMEPALGPVNIHQHTQAHIHTRTHTHTLTHTHTHTHSDFFSQKLAL